MRTDVVSADRADIDDVRYAYRLLLGRAPDEQGLLTFARLVQDRSLRPSELAEYFLGSNEFRSRYSGEIREVELDGYVISIRVDDNDVGRTVAQTRQWEPNVVSALGEHLNRGSRFLDVGANIGYFSAWAAHRVENVGRMIAVEPMDKNPQLIYATSARNGFTHVRVESFAASDESGVVCMGTHEGSSNGEIIRDWSRGDRPLYAQTRRLDDLLAGEERFDVVKFDIEGHELHAWRFFARARARSARHADGVPSRVPAQECASRTRTLCRRTARLRRGHRLAFRRQTLDVQGCRGVDAPVGAGRCHLAHRRSGPSRFACTASFLTFRRIP